MNIKKYWLIAFLLLIVIVTISCLLNKNGTDLRSSQTSETSFTAETKIIHGETEVRPGMVEHVVMIERMGLQEGSIKITLFRPDGELFTEKVYTAPVDTKETIKLGTEIGIWKMDIEYQNATGNYLIRWDAHN